nr:hypothetical protein [uncultured Flavobacterium sp.]
MKNSRKNVFFRPVLILGVICFGYFALNLIFGGWYGYEKWKPRRSTFGNKKEAIERNVFVKDLQFKSSIPIDSFNVYIEKGFRYGYTSSNNTRIIEDNWPFQVSFTTQKGINNVNFYIINANKFGSIDNLNVYIKQAKLNDTLLIGINKWNLSKWDSIGYIKVWDKR